MAVPPVWNTKPHDEAAAARSRSALGVSAVTARLLRIRGITDPDEASRFLKPSLDQLHDPLQLADIECAADRLLLAIANRERIAIHGDYDVDGITSTVILRRALELLGADVGHFIPERLTRRLRPAAGARSIACTPKACKLIVSVDCGIRAPEAARRARELGVDLIITDHHEPDDELPDACAVVNPKRHDCTYPDKNLAGVGVALKLVQALCTRTGKSAWLPAFVKIAVDRHARRRGAADRREPHHRQARPADADEGAAQGRPARAARRRGPDRQDDRQLSHRLHGRAARQRRRPHEHARHRHAAAARRPTRRWPTKPRRWPSSSRPRTRGGAQEEQDIVAKAKKIVETDPEVGARSVLVVAGEGWHRGVIGIVASKLVDAFYRPAIVLSIDGDIAHGSCRSIPASTCWRRSSRARR